MARDPLQTLEKLEQAVSPRVGKILWDNLTRLRDHVRATSGLQKRSHGLPLVRKPLQLQGNVLEAALISPPTWAGVHIGPAGSSSTITAKGGGFLAIPTDFVKTFRGAPAGPKQYGATVIFNGIIWGKAGWGGARTGGGLRQRRAGGEKFKKQDLIPLFILKSSVVIKKRIDPSQSIDWIKPQFLADLKKACLIDRL
ncbi:MAG: hypothetical protein WC600_17180 [Desulfobaccales bacterium]